MGKRRGSQKAMPYFLERIKEKKENKRYGTAELYGVVLNAFLQACSITAEKLVFNDINRKNLATFEQWMREKGLIENTIKTYFANLRAMYHRAESEELTALTVDPFKFFKIKGTPLRKEMLNQKEMTALAMLEFNNEPELEESCDFGLFCYLAQGISFFDSAYLTRENIKDNTIVYKRIKSKETVVITQTDAINKILNKYMGDSLYLFPVFKETHPTLKHYKECLHTYKERFNQIGERINTPFTFTTYSMHNSWVIEARDIDVSANIINLSSGCSEEEKASITEEEQSKIIEVNQWIARNIEKIILQKK